MAFKCAYEKIHLNTYQVIFKICNSRNVIVSFEPCNYKKRIDLKSVKQSNTTYELIYSILVDDSKKAKVFFK